MRELSLHVLDIVQNSIRAKASVIEIIIEEDYNKDFLKITIKDNGQGIPEDKLKQITDPFVTTRKTREVGLGISLFKAACQHCNGDFKINSSPGKGTEVVAVFQHSHLDRAPLGDIVGTLISLFATNPDRDFHFRYIFNGEEFQLKTEEIKAELGSVPLNERSVLRWLEEYLQEGLQELCGGD